MPQTGTNENYATGLKAKVKVGGNKLLPGLPNVFSSDREQIR